MANKKNKITKEEKSDLDILVELSQSHYWETILKFNRQKDSELLSALATIYPFKEPTLMAKTQGCMQGIDYLEGIVNYEIKRRERIENTGTDKSVEDIDLEEFPGYSS